MNIFEIILFVLVGLAIGGFIGRYFGKTEIQKRKYSIIGTLIGGCVAMGGTLIFF
jgi:hypothetical protein